MGKHTQKMVTNVPVSVDVPVEIVVETGDDGSITVESHPVRREIKSQRRTRAVREYPTSQSGEVYAAMHASSLFERVVN